MAMNQEGISLGNYCSFTTRVDKVHYLWEINNYSFFDAKGEDLCSPIFTSDTTDKCKWYLVLKPNGETECKRYMKLAVALDHSSECKAVFAAHSMYILDCNQTKVYSREDKKLYRFDIEGKNQWGYPKFIYKEDLFTDKLLPNNKLTIYFEATFSDVDSFIDIQNHSIPNSFEHSVLQDDPLEDFERLFKNQDFSDFVISVKDKRFQAHKFILAARSPVFAAMFTHDTKESKTNEVEITDIDENVIEDMLYYMYTGKFQNLDSLACDLLKTADKYGMERMKAKCENALLKNLSVENAADILVLADLYRASALKFRTIKFIVIKFSKVMNTEAWNKMVFSHPHLINEVCKAALSNQSIIQL